MGQAKRRGTFEERKALAVEREIEARKRRVEKTSANMPTLKSKKLALYLAMGLVNHDYFIEGKD